MQRPTMQCRATDCDVHVASATYVMQFHIAASVKGHCATVTSRDAMPHYLSFTSRTKMHLNLFPTSSRLLCHTSISFSSSSFSARYVSVLRHFLRVLSGLGSLCRSPSMAPKYHVSHSGTSNVSAAKQIKYQLEPLLQCRPLR